MCPAGAQGRVSRRSEPRIRAAAGTAVSARRLIALMVTRVIIRLAVLAGRYDAGTRLIQRYRGRAVLLPESAPVRQAGTSACGSAPVVCGPGWPSCNSCPFGKAEGRRSASRRIVLDPPCGGSLWREARAHRRSIAASIAHGPRFRSGRRGKGHPPEASAGSLRGLLVVPGGAPWPPECKACVGLTRGRRIRSHHHDAS